ncbi:MAG TPA: hypothetical protein VIV55_09860 [Flavobacterium sp.]
MENKTAQIIGKNYEDSQLKEAMMEIKVEKVSKSSIHNHFAMCYKPFKERETTYYLHRKGIVGIDFVNDFYGNEIMLEFVKDGFYYSTRIKEFKTERSLALLISKFHLEIELLQNKPL